MEKQTFYEVFDINKPICEANIEIQADSPMKAIKSYLKGIGMEYDSIKVDGGNFAQYRAMPYYYKNGEKYRYNGKKAMWYSIIQKTKTN